MYLERHLMDYDQVILDTLQPEPGDLIISEFPYEDATIKDFEFKNLNGFDAGHTSLWVTGDKPLAHAVREGYHLPGVRLTHFFEGRHILFRTTNPEIKAAMQQASEILKTWGLATREISLEQYQSIYPEKDWKHRYKKDIPNFFSTPTNKIAAPAIAYNEQRAEGDKFAIARQPKIQEFSHESLRRAIKFATRRELSSDVSKGQRCTAIAMAAIQAAFLAPIIKPATEKISFKQYKNRPIQEYINEYLIDNWQEKDIGKRLEKALEQNNFNGLFPAPFMKDQRYALPTTLLKSLKLNSGFERIGQISCFKEYIAIYDSNFNKIETSPTNSNSITKLI